MIRAKLGPTILASACIIGVLLGNTVGAQGQNYPSKAVRIIVAFTVGGAYDIMARIVAQNVGERLNVPMVVENRTGAGGNIGATMAAKLPPDGYNIFVCTVSNATSPALFRKLAYDPLTDFVPITLAVSFDYVLAVHPTLPVKSVRQLIELAKRRPDQLAYGSGGIGTTPHLAVEMMRVMRGIRLIHVPYGGNPAAQQDLFAGQIQMLFINTPNALPLMGAGRVRGLAISSQRRSQLAPELPTMSEEGLPGFDIDAWAGFCTPAKTPNEIIAKLNLNISNSLASPEIRKKLLTQGFEIPALPPAKFRAYFESEIDKYAKLIREAKIEPR